MFTNTSFILSARENILDVMRDIL